MNKKSRLVSASGALLAIAVALPLAGCQSAGEDDGKAAEAIKALGGRVKQDLPGPGNAIDTVYFRKDTDAALKAARKDLEGLKRLMRLDLVQSDVTDAGLKEVAGLKCSQFLLNETKVTDAGLKELVGLQNLDVLKLSGTGVTDGGLKYLAGLKSLTGLNLSSTKVTDAGVAELQKALPNCKITR